MTEAVSRIVTAHASKYLQQLCKHFAHKLTVSCDEAAGAISFPLGGVKLGADADALRVRLEAANADDLEKLKDVVERHLVRFAIREELSVVWQDAA